MRSEVTTITNSCYLILDPSLSRNKELFLSLRPDTFCHCGSTRWQCIRSVNIMVSMQDIMQMNAQEWWSIQLTLLVMPIGLSKVFEKCQTMWIAAWCRMGRSDSRRKHKDAVFPHLNSRESFDELIWLCLLSCMSSLADIPCLDGLWDWYRFALRSTPTSSQFMMLDHFLVRKSFLIATT
jgi:hypothetical protein